MLTCFMLAQHKLNKDKTLGVSERGEGDCSAANNLSKWSWSGNKAAHYCLTLLHLVHSVPKRFYPKFFSEEIITIK
jgi:hypothetical protein